MISLFLCAGIISSWLMFFSILLLYVIKLDTGFNFVIFNKWQHLKHWISIAIIMAVSFYILFLRIKRRGISINIYEVWKLVVNIIGSLYWSQLFLFIIILGLGLIFFILVFKFIYLYLRKSFLALYLYYYQYKTFRKMNSNKLHIHVVFDYCFLRLVKRFTNNRYLLNRCRYIWPMPFYLLEPRIFKFILPYLFIFDWITQDGVISKIFIVLPWYYIYMLIRASWLLMGLFFGLEYPDISNSIYRVGIDIHGNTHRWVSLIEFGDSYYKEEEDQEAEFTEIESKENKPAE